MLKQTSFNAFFSMAAQAASMFSILFVASQIQATEFGELMLQLSYAAILTILLTLQFERVYVRLSTRQLPSYQAFHLVLITFLHLLALLPAYFIKGWAVSVMIGFGMALNQVANYSLARMGRFNRIWALKAVQGGLMLACTVLLWSAGRLDEAWLIFFVSSLGASALMFNQDLLFALRRKPLRKARQRLLYSFPIAWKALGTLSVDTLLRELPVYLSGLTGQPQIAASYGLVARVVGAPVGLVARSAAAVVSNHVARRVFAVKEMLQLAVVPFIGAVLMFGSYMILPRIEAFHSYENLRNFIIIMCPFYIAKAYTGLLGPAIVYFQLQGYEFLLNLIVLTLAFLISLAVKIGHVQLMALPVAISLCTLSVTPFLITSLAKSIRNGAN